MPKKDFTREDYERFAARRPGAEPPESALSSKEDPRGKLERQRMLKEIEELAGSQLPDIREILEKIGEDPETTLYAVAAMVKNRLEGLGAARRKPYDVKLQALFETAKSYLLPDGRGFRMNDAAPQDEAKKKFKEVLGAIVGLLDESGE